MRLITDILRDVRRGKAVDFASVELQALVKDVQATGKAGEITLKLKVTPDKADPDVIKLGIEIKTKSPRPDMPDGMFFANKDGDLLREDPKRVHRFAEAGASLADAEDEIDPETGEVTPRRRADA